MARSRTFAKCSIRRESRIRNGAKAPQAGSRKGLLNVEQKREDFKNRSEIPLRAIALAPFGFDSACCSAASLRSGWHKRGDVHPGRHMVRCLLRLTCEVMREISAFCPRILLPISRTWCQSCIRARTIYCGRKRHSLPHNGKIHPKGENVSAEGKCSPPDSPKADFSLYLDPQNDQFIRFFEKIW